MAKSKKIDREQLEAMKRGILFKVCKTRKELSSWIDLFLEIQLPDCVVDPESNSTPIDLLWEIYSKAVANDDEDFRSILAYSCRSGFKTVSAAILETLFLLHLKRDVIHLAALEDQSLKCKEYVQSYFAKPLLIETQTIDNQKNIGIHRYEHNETKEAITPVAWKALPYKEQIEYTEIINKIRIVKATIKSANGQHAPLLTIDEADLIEGRRVLEEARRIPSASFDGGMPITFYTSTRKSGTGPVQKMIDESEKKKMQIRHWNIIDCTEACPESRNKSLSGPKVDLYVDRSQFKTINKNEFMLLPEAEKAKYVHHKAFPGCATCPIFAGCQGNLATRQKSKAAALKSIPVTIQDFRDSDLDTIISQLMCWKPSTTGLIYPSFDVDKHVITASAMAKMVTGEDHPTSMSKHELINLLRHNKEVKFFTGMDHGYTHPFVAVSGALVGQRLYIFDAIYLKQVELHDKIEHCKSKITWSPIVFSDTAALDQNKAFIAAGFALASWAKTEINIGIECVRQKLRPGIDLEPEIYFLHNDPGVAALVNEMQKYHWDVDGGGTLLDIPVKVDDDGCDALRYLCQNLFANTGQIKAGLKVGARESTIKTAEQQLREIVRNSSTDVSEQSDDQIINRKGIRLLF